MILTFDKTLAAGINSFRNAPTEFFRLLTLASRAAFKAKVQSMVVAAGVALAMLMLTLLIGARQELPDADKNGQGVTTEVSR